LPGPLFFESYRMSKSLALGCLLGLAAGSTAAQAWRHLGPPGGMVISLAPGADATVYLGTPDGHVFASGDRGEHWQLRGRAGARADAVVQHLAPDRVRRERVLAAVWFQDATEGGGLFESLDGGRDWKPAGLSGEAVRAIEQSGSDPRVWVAGTLSGVFLSLDDARSWRRITPKGHLELRNVDSLAIDPQDPRTLYVGTYHLPWKTADAGRTWSPIGSGMIDDSDVMSLRIDSQDRNRLFSSACSGIYRSDDAGASWTKLTGIPYSSRRTQQIVQDPANPSVFYAGTTEGLWTTADHGETWKRTAPGEPGANAVVALPMEKGTRLLLGSDSGVLRSDDQGVSFAPSNEGFAHGVIAAFAADPRDSRHFLLRMGDSGRLRETHDGGTSWADLPWPAGTKSVAGIFATSLGWWVSFREGGLARFDASKSSWRAVAFRDPAPARGASRRAPRRATGRSSRAPRVSSLRERPGETLAASDDGLWRLAAGDAEFRRLDAGRLPKSVRFLSASSTGLLAIADEQVWSRGETGPWNRLPAPPASGALRWVEERAAQGKSLRMLGTQNGVFRSESAGAWQPVSGGLPAIDSSPPAFSGSTSVIAMGNGGIYRSASGFIDWQRIDSAEQGNVTAVAFLEEQELIVASRSEGLFRTAALSQ
jgi:photosystem II stability/assembly factor-like uncharacterized protein